ncbi:hypothetical protein D3C87_1833960 [compost metagenome]
MSLKFAGTMIELFFAANCENASTYCSATFKFTASAPPGSRIAAAVFLKASALASAIERMAAA